MFSSFPKVFGRSISRIFSKVQNNSLQFFVNDEAHSIENPSGLESLANYLRSNSNKSVKLGCEEGGCGACTVMIQYEDIFTKEIVTKSVNSCLVSLPTVEGMHVLTLEYLKNTDGMKLINDEFVSNNASQCGFCTPGFEVAIYSYLATLDEKPKFSNIEKALSGNLCRCTGYRAIVSATKNIFENWPKDEVDDLFPNELKGLDWESKKFISSVPGEKDLIFHIVKDIDELIELKGTYGNDMDVKIINGGTEVMLESNLLDKRSEVLLYPRGVKELNELYEDDSVIRIGGSVTLADIEKFCHEREKENMVFEIIKNQLEVFASPSIRNLAVIAGNIVNASPTSDLCPIMIAANAIFHIKNSKGIVREIAAKDFFFGYKKVDLESDEILVSIEIPKMKENEFIREFKASKRREDDIAIVTGCMRIEFDEDKKVKSSAFTYGCLNVIPVTFTKVGEFLKGKELTKDVFDQSLKIMADENPLIDNAPGGMIEYRKTLPLSYWKKFFLELRRDFYNEELSLEDASALRKFKRDVSKGEQFYNIEQRGVSVGLPEDNMHGQALVRGEAKYVDDMFSWGDELHLGLLLADVPRGIIKDIDWSEALEIDGVCGYIDHNDIPGENLFGVAIHDEELIVSEEITAIGQIIGAIIAEDPQTAKIAVKKVKVDIEEDVEAILTIDDAIENDSMFDFKPMLNRGNVNDGFNDSEHILEGDLYIGGQNHWYLEPNASVAIPMEDDNYYVISSTQNVGHIQGDVALVMGIDQKNVVVKTKRLGGGFGGKETRSGTFACAAVIASKKFQSPVRIVLDRHVDDTIGGQRHPFKGTYKVGFSNDGDINGLEIEMYSNCGYSTDLSYPVLERALYLFDNAYNIKNLNIKGNPCKTNKPTNTAMRGFGGPQAVFFQEYIIDKVANYLDIDPNVIRKKHFYQTNDTTPYGMELDDCRIEQSWDEVLQLSNYNERVEMVKEFNSQNKYKKRGIYLTPMKFGISFAQTFLNQAGSLVHIYRDGSVLISHAGIEMGQGLHTKVAQVASTTLGVPMNKIQITETSSDKVANASPTSASTGSDLNGMATHIACEEIMEGLKPLMDEMGYHDGKCTWEELINAAYFARVNLTGQGFYATPGIVNMDWETGLGRPFSYFTYGASCAEVEVDCLTGDHNMIQMDMVFDCGKSINPSIDIGQVEGAFVQAYGWLTMEELIWGDDDHPWVKPKGSLHAKGPGYYKIPSVNDIPKIMNVKLMPDSDNPHAIQSSKGIGEPPYLLANSVFFAITNAIREYRKENGLSEDFQIDPPCTIEKIRMACSDEITDFFVDGEYVAKASY